MRFVGKVFLILSVVLSFLVLLISITARFQLLDSAFWINSFRQGDIYQKLEGPLTRETENTFLEEGVGQKEAKIFASILLKDSLQDLVEKNTINFLDFINNKSQELIIYFPLAKLPASIKQDLELNSDEFSLDYLLRTFGRGSTPIGEEFFVQLRSLGNAITISLIVAVVSLVISLYLVYRLETPGERLVATAISLIASGVITIIFIILLNLQITNMARDLVLPDKEPSQILLGTLAPPLITNVVNVWLVVSLITIVLGALSLLIKKPVQSPNATKTGKA